MQVNSRQRLHAIGRHSHPAADLFLNQQPRSKGLLDPSRHACARLARPNDHNSPDRAQRQFFLADYQPLAFHMQVLAHQPVAADGVHGGTPNRQRVAFQVAIQGHSDVSSCVLAACPP
jgi:hypothetical protein